ncbi:MAG: glycosyltransferase family 4 protein [Desulfobacteraceae bacterium]|nr:glycosyltransferase family 4 protein [Desulfobacteraceae bacterium]
MKILWICHFSNAEVRKKLSLSNYTVSNTLRKTIGKKKTEDYTDFAPWVTNMIKEFEQFENIELHIISPHRGLKRYKQSFTIKNIHYNFFKPDLPILNVSPDMFMKKYKFRLNRYLVSGFVKKIQPDIVNLIGAENPYYSITALDIKNIPVYLSCQTVYSNPLRYEHSSVNQHRWDTELMIHRNIQYFGCTGRMHRDLVLKNNENAIVFKMFFPIQKPKGIVQQSKEYDFVFFAGGLNKKKGAEDAIYALQKVKEVFPKVTLNMIGRCSAEYKNHLQNIIDELKLNYNIIFIDSFPKHADLLTHITKSRFAVLPNKLDVISGTIIESILLDIPVVTYKTTGSPYLNKNGEAVLLANIGDIDTLAQQMIELMKNPDKAQQLAANARRFVKEEFDNTRSAKRLLDNYHQVIEHYQNGKVIDKNQLFDTNEFPIYD